MATIRPRKQADGSTRYTAIVRIRRGKTIVYQEYRTFALRTAAVSWANGPLCDVPSARRAVPIVKALVCRKPPHIFTTVPFTQYCIVVPELL
jgi:hypothetical protein